ncbi:MAG: hypothetical protein ABI822_19270 [Bryobacteraceae bacterium]
MNMQQDSTRIGILVHGDNHFIVRGPLPDRETALALVQHWSLIQIGAETPPALARWSIISKALRENLTWAMIVPGNGEFSGAICELLEELRVRLTIHDLRDGEDRTVTSQ